MSSALTSAQWVAQDLYFYCGPAVAQMVLQSVGAAVIKQGDLFDDIIAASTGQPHAGIGRLPNFPKQHCQKCQQVWRCWFSAPTALLKVINHYVVGGPLVLLKVATSQKKGAVARIIASVDKGVAPAFLTSGDHWRVAWGYEFGTGSQDFPVTKLAGVDVTGVYIHDSDPDLAELSLMLQSVPTFMSDFTAVDCGPGVAGKHVAIVA